MAYATDADVAAVNSDVFNAGIEDLTAFHTEATRVIDRILDQNWYRDQCGEYGVDWREDAFDADLMLNASTQLKYAAVYKFIALAAERLDNYADEGGKWERLRDHFEQRFQDEIAMVISGGIDYDWDQDGSVEIAEKGYPIPSRLARM